MKRYVFSFFLIVFLLLFFIGCGGDNDEVIAEINGEKITKEEYNQRYQRIEKFYNDQGAEINEMETKIEEEIIDDLVVEKILVQEAERKGVGVGDKDLEEEFDSIKGELGGKEGLQKSLELYDMTESELRKEITNQMLFMLLMEEVIDMDDIEVTEEELKERYEEKIEKHDIKQEMIQSEQEGISQLESFEAIKPELEEMIKQEKKQEYFEDYIEELKERSNIEILK
ncbi:SurA N-terminal domain-containing protein [Natranaerofaba carboxydovora]|uniref:SurA N-terminal domain-containing protein n=1 Tax=Natranaerofaba carboxydovora TaxID=2742683 RepID=UPI001F1302CE|nr:SurA N-terminal domain-containing protein [Natranaerofaba carboxydovora]